MTTAITGASGALEHACAGLLLLTVHPREVVLTTRHPVALADSATRGAEVRRAGSDEPGTPPSASAGGDRLLLVPTDAIGARLDQQRAAIARRPRSWW